MSCYPILKKVLGDDGIEVITPVVDAQFLIGRSWDASLRLNNAEIHDHHCTIEKVDAGKWTVVSHENATVCLNHEQLSRGLPRLLKFEDLLRIASGVLFRFTCSCMDKKDLSNSDIPTAKRPKLEMNSYEASTLRGHQVPDVHSHDNANLMISYEQLKNDNINLTARLKKIEDMNMLLNKEKEKTEGYYITVLDSYNSLVEQYSELRRQKEESDRSQNCDMNLLRDTISAQTANVDRLQNQLSQLQQSYCSVESTKQNLENQNKQLLTENGILHLRVERFLEYSKILHVKNSDLQTQVNNLIKEKDDLRRELDNKVKDMLQLSSFKVPCLPSTDVSAQTSDSFNNMQNSLTELLESEFKCSICDEVFIEAVVTNCTHVFCSYCIKSWKSIKSNCPICRSALSKEVKVLPLDSFLNNVMPLTTENLRTNWLKIAEERKVLKEKSMVKSTAPPAYPTYTTALPTESVGNFHNAIMNVYRHLIHYEDVIDLTNDRAYGM